MLSMMLQSKILKTKKRLSDPKWYLPSIVITLMGLFGTLSFCMRAVSVGWNHGLVSAYLPVLQTQVEDQSISTKSFENLSSESIAIVINEFAMYFGSIDSFTINYVDIRNKFMVPHYEGAPQIQTLLKEIDAWKKTKPHLNSSVVVAVEPDFPIAILIQIIAHLNRSQMFSKVVIAGGML